MRRPSARALKTYSVLPDVGLHTLVSTLMIFVTQDEDAPPWILYSDGSAKGGQAGWGWALVTGGDGEADEEVEDVDRSSRTEAAPHTYIGAHK